MDCRDQARSSRGSGVDRCRRKNSSVDGRRTSTRDYPEPLSEPASSPVGPASWASDRIRLFRAPGPVGLRGGPDAADGLCLASLLPTLKRGFALEMVDEMSASSWPRFDYDLQAPASALHPPAGPAPEGNPPGQTPARCLSPRSPTHPARRCGEESSSIRSSREGRSPCVDSRHTFPMGRRRPATAAGESGRADRPKPRRDVPATPASTTGRSMFHTPARPGPSIIASPGRTRAVPASCPGWGPTMSAGGAATTGPTSGRSTRPTTSWCRSPRWPTTRPWNGRTGSAAAGRATPIPLPKATPPTYPLISSHSLWAFTLNASPSVVDVDDPNAYITFQQTPIEILNTGQAYNATQALADRIRAFTHAHHPRAQGIKSPSVRTPASGGHQPFSNTPCSS